MKTNSNDIKDFELNEISQKLLRQILNHQNIDNRIEKYNEKYPHYPFENILSHLFEKAIVKYQSSIEQLHWINGVREEEIKDNGVIEENLNIINDFLNIESNLSMRRFMVNNAPEFKDKDIKDVHTIDFSLVCSLEQLELFNSVLFSKENHEIIISYYLDYIYRFPIKLPVFEKNLFYSLIFLTNTKYPTNVTSANSLSCVQEINQFVRMKYIDLNDPIIQAFFHLICIEDELLKCSNAIYMDIKHNHDLLRRQFDAMAS